MSRHLFVIFGATGDLTKRKLLPAFHALQCHVAQGDHCVVLGVARSELTDGEFQQTAIEALEAVGVSTTEASEWVGTYVRYQSIGPGFGALASRIEALETSERLSGNRVFYLALPPGVFESTLDGLGEVGLHDQPK